MTKTTAEPDSSGATATAFWIGVAVLAVLNNWSFARALHNDTWRTPWFWIALLVHGGIVAVVAFDLRHAHPGDVRDTSWDLTGAEKRSRAAWLVDVVALPFVMVPAYAWARHRIHRLATVARQAKPPSKTPLIPEMASRRTGDLLVAAGGLTLGLIVYVAGLAAPV